MKLGLEPPKAQRTSFQLKSHPQRLKTEGGSMNMYEALPFSNIFLKIFQGVLF